MKGKISKIKNTKGELALPITTVEAVYMEDGTTKLSDEMKDVLKYERFDDEDITAEIPSVKEEIDGIKEDISEINSSLDNKANKNEVVIKGEGTLSDFDEATRLAIQGLSPTDINAVLGTENVAYENVKKNSIYVDNLGFIRKPSNADVYFTKEMVNGYILNNVNGNLVANESYCTTGFINVEQNIQYFCGLRSINTAVNIQRWCFYDKDKVFLSYGASADNFTTPTNCKFVRLSFSASWFNKTNDIKLQINSLTPLEPYECKENLKIERYETLRDDMVDTSNMKDNSISPSKIDFIQEPSNKDYLIVKKTKRDISLDVNGNEVVNGTRCTVDGFIKVEPNTKYCLGKISDNTPINIQVFAFYDNNKVFIDYNGNFNNFTTPSNCYYVKLTLAIVWADTITDIKLQKDSLTFLNPYECTIDLKIPRYEPKIIDYIKTEVDDTIRKIIDNTEEQSVSFAFITDLHCDDSQGTSKASIKRQLTAMVEIANNSPLDFICLGGDLYSGNYFKDNKQDAKNLLLELIEPLKNSKKPVVVLKGNHDDNSYYKIHYPSEQLLDSKILSCNEYYAHTNGMLQGTKNSSGNYFYFDINEKNTRVICLNSADAPTTLNPDGTRKYAGCNYFGYSLEQLKWLLSVLDNPNKKYILLAHIGTDIFTVYNRDILLNIISALNTKTMFTGLDTTKDFSSYKGLELYCFGHLHADRIEKTSIVGDTITVSVGSGILDNTPINSEESDNRYTRAIGRKYGEISEALFDIVINKENEIMCIRFGAGEDRSINK